MFTRQGLWQTWRDIRPYLVFSVILFFASIVAGGTPNDSTDWLRGQLQGIAELADKARQTDNPQLSLFFLIFVNNLVKSIMAMYLGIAASILPVVMLVSNGLIMGYLFGGMADQGENVWLMIAKGILPHGVLELPAFFLACAFGIRMGVCLLKGIFGSLLGREEPWKPLSRTAAATIPALILVTWMLIAAAVIESTVTYWLVS